MKPNKFFNLLLLLVTLFAYTSCEKDETPKAPELPPLEALAMDFSDFDNPNYAGEAKKSTHSLVNQYRNFGYSFLTVTAWNTVAGIVMAVPTAAYAAALNETPKYMGDKSWEWNVSVLVGAITYSARLVAKRLSNEEFKAEMFVTSSKSGLMGFEDFKWFEGTIRYDHTHAEWTLYESPSNPAAVLTMEWNNNYETDLWDITYTSVKPGTAENGSYIKFEVSADPEFDAKYTVLTEDGTVIIQWNRASKAGRVKNEPFFGDSLWHCWNRMFQDMNCG
jgi:hypothetical protein